MKKSFSTMVLSAVLLSVVTQLNASEWKWFWEKDEANIQVPTCATCEAPAPAPVVVPVVNQCPKQVVVVNYTDGCNTCKGTYAVTVRKNSCCSAQGCDK